MPTRARRGAARILIAEDDASLRRLLEMRLGVDGYTTRAVADGAAALEMLGEWLPDVVVTDVMMPRLSGLSLCREMRASPRTAAIPIILLTARCFDDDMQAAVDLGRVSFMNKPFDAAALKTALGDALRGEVAVPHTGGSRSGA